MGRDFTPLETYATDRNLEGKLRGMLAAEQPPMWKVTRVNDKTGETESWEEPMFSTVARQLYRDYPEVSFLAAGLLESMFDEFVGKIDGQIDENSKIEAFKADSGWFLKEVEESIEKIENLYYDESIKCYSKVSACGDPAVLLPDHAKDSHIVSSVDEAVYKWFSNSRFCHYTDSMNEGLISDMRHVRAHLEKVRKLKDEMEI